MLRLSGDSVPHDPERFHCTSCRLSGQQECLTRAKCASMPLSKAETARPTILGWQGSCGVPREETIVAPISVACTPHDPELHMTMLMCVAHEHEWLPCTKLHPKVLERRRYTRNSGVGADRQVLEFQSYDLGKGILQCVGFGDPLSRRGNHVATDKREGDTVVGITLQRHL